MLKLSEAGIISTCLQGVLYGFAVLMFLLTMYILLGNRRRKGVNRPMLGASCALIILASAEFAVNVVRLINGFVKIGPHRPGGIESFFSDVTEVTFIVKGALYNVQTLILDAIVIYRAHMVWQQLWVMIPPCTGWCALLACTIGLNRAFITASVNSDNVFANQTAQWVTATYATTLATNLMATSLLAYRIWRVNRMTVTTEFISTERRRLTPILLVVIESGAIYSVTIIAALVAFVTNSIGVYIILDLISPIISIVYNMIFVRIGLASERGLSAVHIGDSHAVSSRRGPHEDGSSKPAGVALAVNVELTQIQHFDIDESSLSGTGLAIDERKLGSLRPESKIKLDRR